MKKSTSKTFSASTRLSWLTSFRSVASREFAGGALTALHRLELLAPGIQQPSMDTQFLRQRHDVVALVQPVHGHLPKGLRKLAHAFLGHLPPPSCVKCAHSSCLNLGGQSTNAAYRLLFHANELVEE